MTSNVPKMSPDDPMSPPDHPAAVSEQSGSLIAQARALLADVTPLRSNCGKHCGTACCQPDEDGRGGMLLFPGEEPFYLPTPAWATIGPSDFVVHGKPISLLTCTGTCPRAGRPLACRLFPLTPIVRNGAATVALDTRAWPVCPLMEYGMQGLSRAFVDAAQIVAEMLFEDAASRTYVKALTEHLDAIVKL